MSYPTAIYGYDPTAHGARLSGRASRSAGDYSNGGELAGFFDWLGTAIVDAGTYVWEHDPLVHIVTGIANGENVGDVLLETVKLQGDVLKEVGPYVQAVASLVPGFGTVVGIALGAAIALAQGKRIDKVLIEAAAGAIPGGKFVRAAFDAGTAALEAIIDGKTLEDVAIIAAITAAREAARAAAGDAGVLAFDTALALTGALLASQRPAGPVAKFLAANGVPVVLGGKDPSALLKVLQSGVVPDPNLAWKMSQGTAYTHAAMRGTEMFDPRNQAGGKTVMQVMADEQAAAAKTSAALQQAAFSAAAAAARRAQAAQGLTTQSAAGPAEPVIPLWAWGAAGVAFAAYVCTR